MMCGYPVVGENCVRLLRLGGVFKHMHVHANCTECLHGCIEFFSCDRAECVSSAINSSLKRVVGRRLGVRIKPAGPNHQHGVGALRDRNALSHFSCILPYLRRWRMSQRELPFVAPDHCKFHYQSPKEISTSRAVCTISPFGGTSLSRLTASAIGTWRT